jgi:hypothetical protein
MSKTQPASVQAGRQRCGGSGSLGLTDADFELLPFLCPARFVRAKLARQGCDEFPLRSFEEVRLGGLKPVTHDVTCP